MKISCTLLFTLCVAQVWTFPRQVREEPAATSGRLLTRVVREEGAVYTLPDNAELIVGPVKSTFSCQNREYGYFADKDNNCQIFHVCVHHEDRDNGVDQKERYSFFCGNQTVFDQANLVCTIPDDATPCKDAEALYNHVNSKFGVIDPPRG